MVVFRQRVKIFSELPVGDTIVPRRVFLTAKPTPYTLVSSGGSPYQKRV